MAINTPNNIQRVNVYFRETSGNLPQSIDGNKEGFTLSENTKHQVIRLFRELLSKPQVVVAIKEKIHQIPDPIVRIQLSNALFQTGSLHNDIARVHSKTHDRLEYLLTSIEKTKKPSTTA